MALKRIHRVLMPQDIQMDRTKLKQPLPLASMEQFDPFLLLHHFDKREQMPGERPLVEIGAHPHRGFEPVTFIFDGAIRHKDSRGNDSIISSGGVQWMTAGMGIVHSEELPREFVEEGGSLEIIQLWINLPKKLKMVQPKYQGFQASDIPKITLDDHTTLNVISGKYGETRGPVKSITNITAYTCLLGEKSQLHLQFPAAHHTMIYQLRGHTDMNGVDVSKQKLVLFDQGGEGVEIKGEKGNSLLLILSAKPIEEPVVTWGPYVMNTQTEVMEAMRDYQMGRMGILI